MTVVENIIFCFSQNNFTDQFINTNTFLNFELQLHCIIFLTILQTEWIPCNNITYLKSSWEFQILFYFKVLCSTFAKKNNNLPKILRTNTWKSMRKSLLFRVHAVSFLVSNVNKGTSIFMIMVPFYMYYTTGKVISGNGNHEVSTCSYELLYFKGNNVSDLCNIVHNNLKHFRLPSYDDNYLDTLQNFSLESSSVFSFSLFRITKNNSSDVAISQVSLAR